jgi:hypothetical protein
MSERWAAVVGWEGYYEASDAGGCRRIITKYGNPSERPLRPGRRVGYANYTLSVDKVKKTYAAHRLVWETFNGPIPEGLQINHKNGVKTDNRLENLELCTPSENTRHAVHVLHRPWSSPPHVPGVKNGRAKLDETGVALVKRLRSEGWSQQRIADHVGINQTAVSALLRGATWRHVNS